MVIQALMRAKQLMRTQSLKSLEDNKIVTIIG